MIMMLIMDVSANATLPSLDVRPNETLLSMDVHLNETLLSMGDVCLTFERQANVRQTSANVSKRQKRCTHIMYTELDPILYIHALPRRPPKGRRERDREI